MRNKGCWEFSCQKVKLKERQIGGFFSEPPFYGVKLHFLLLLPVPSFSDPKRKNINVFIFFDFLPFDVMGKKHGYFIAFMRGGEGTFYL